MSRDASLKLVVPVGLALATSCYGSVRSNGGADESASAGAAGLSESSGAPSAGVTAAAGVPDGTGGSAGAGTTAAGSVAEPDQSAASGASGEAPEGDDAGSSGAAGAAQTEVEIIEDCLLDDPERPEKTVPHPTGTITLTRDATWLLEGITYVEDGDVLSIEPCTTIKGDTPTLGTLFVSRGGRLVADGQRDAPILFTSRAERGERSAGDWVGVVIAGRAPNSVGDEAIVEVFPDDPRYQHGGDDENDDSGILRYVRIEYAGVELGNGDEVDGLTLASVGSNTTLEYIMVAHSLDDGIEFFGGTVDARFLVVNNPGDDMFDVDWGYQGTLENLFGRQARPLSSDPNGLEVDGSYDGQEPFTDVTIRNATLCGTGQLGDAVRRGMLLREGLSGSLDNVVALGFDTGVDARDAFGTVQEPAVSITNSIFFDNTNLIGDPAEPDNDEGFDEDAWFQAGEGNSTTDPGFTVEDCLKTPPDGAVTESGVGAFAEDPDWMQGMWIDWSEN